MTVTDTSAYETLRSKLREAAVFASVTSVLSWDQETYMPAGGGEARAEQMAAMAGLVHERKTASELADLIAQAADEVGSDDVAAVNVARMQRDFDRETKLPSKLVANIARTSSIAQDAWKAARASNDFAAFKPHLEKMLELTRQKAECWGTPDDGELYDALLDEYEPNARATEIEAVFGPLGNQLSELVAELMDAPNPPSLEPFKRPVAISAQAELGRHVLSAFGFDLNTGRLDVTAHPFCQDVGPGDTRLTTRYTEAGVGDALFSTMHEGGHGLYEQNLPKAERFGEPLGQSISLGIHESQSRFWENIVGRSAEFWRWLTPTVKDLFGDGYAHTTADELYRAANVVERSYIRVESDEATYNLHVMLRFELERALVSGELSVADLPGAWNERFERLLGVPVPDDARGCLQDVHWSFGLIGYFPTYTLGNLYAAQFTEAMEAELGQLGPRIERGEFGPIREWLTDNIYSQGRRYEAGELCERITGKALSDEPLMRYLRGKLRPVYGL
ncbi:MAG: carboxypeptidase M32 [Planctomycetota bacterium]